MSSEIFRRVIPSRNYYPIVAVMVAVTMFGVTLTVVGECKGVDYVSALGSGLLASGIVSLILFVMESKKERRQNLETLFFITQRFANKIGYARPLSVGCNPNRKTLEFYESLFKDLDRFEEVWGKLWFSSSDRDYYYRTIYSTMGSYCQDLRTYWDFRSATGAPDEAYIKDIISLQTYVFDKDGNNIMKDVLERACDRLLDQMSRQKV